jgi:competence protein ComEA
VVSDEAVAQPVVSEAVVSEEAVAQQVVAEEAVAELAVSAEDVEAPVAVQVVLPEAEAASPASVTRASRAVSINTATIDELSRVKGLNGKVAKEIVKNRPYASLEGLVEVRGIGRKMLDKIRSLITL